LSLKLGKFGAFVGCSRYPECKYSRVLAPSGAEASEGDRPGVRVLGQDPSTGEEISLRNGRFGEYIQQGEGEKPKRSSLPKGLSADDVTLEKALKLLALPREVARHPTSGEAILAGIGRYGSYVQHGKTYANLGRDDDVLEIGGNRAIDLIVAKESGAGGSRFGAGAGRELGEHPEGGKVSVKAGRFGSYVNHGKINATIAKGTDPASLTLAEAIELLKAKAAGGNVIGRLVGEHPDGGAITVRDGRYGAYVNWGKVNATISKGTTPDSITLSDALELIAEREGKPVARPGKPAKKAPTTSKVTPAKAAGADAGARAKTAAPKQAAAKKAAGTKPKTAAGKRS
jgi:DNA topoisomerase I